jgi:SAM-dependent methyltransferase
MPSSDGTLNVFVSYSRRDRVICERLMTHLIPLNRKKTVNTWVDTQIQPGTAWQEELEAALGLADVAILLISPDFQASPFIQEQEVPALLAAAEVRGCAIIPLIVEPTFWKDGVISRYQAANDKALSLLSPPRRNKVLADFVEKIATLRSVPAARTKSSTPRAVNYEDGERSVPPPAVLEAGGPTGETANPGAGSVYRRSIHRIMADYLKPRGIALSSLMPQYPSLDFSIRDLQKLCAEGNRNWRLDAMIKVLDEARRAAYDEKYGQRKPTLFDDERWTDDIQLWVREVKFILAKMLHIEEEDYPDLRVINVGIGSGKEGRGLYDRFGSGEGQFIGVDISAEALAQAKQEFPRMMKVECSAEALGLGSDCADLYLSFRTFQSTFFDVTRAVYQALHVLDYRGSFLVSIPNKYVQVELDGKVTLRSGLLPAGSEPLDPDTPYPLDPHLPWMHVEKVRRALTVAGFEDIGVYTGMYEIYVYARRSDPSRLD